MFLAEQTSLKRQVAIKVLRSDFVAHDVYRKRFEQEAKAAAALNHPNIVQVFAVGEAGGTHYIAQEYIQGVNLRQFLNRKGPPELPVALRIMKQVAVALQAAGDAGIVHRDIKPENIMITRKGVVKVTDFGLAQLTQGPERLNLTQDGVTVGTPLYMSPEQVHGAELDQRSDIYSLGVTYYHLLAGRPPFDGETALSVAFRHVHDAPPPLAERRADLPAGLHDLVHKMMAKQREDRLPDAKSVWKELVRIEKSTTSTPTDVDLSLGETTAFTSTRSGLSRLKLGMRDRRSQLVRLGVTGACVFLVAAAAGWLTAPPDPFDSPLPATTAVSRQEDAQAQFYLAMTLVDDDEAWASVERYFPESTRVVQLARSHLAVLYLREHRFDEASALFSGLAALGDADVALHAKGLAGMAVVASLKGDFQESHRMIETELLPIREKLDREMQELVRGAIRRNQQMRTDEVRRISEDLFRTPPQDDTPTFE